MTKYDQEFKKLCPEWNEFLKTHSINDELHSDCEIRLGIRHFATCIVGESHNFDRSYADEYKENYCKICDELGLEFYQLCNYFDFGDLNADENSKKELYKILVPKMVKHFKNDHKDICKQKGLI